MTTRSVCPICGLEESTGEVVDGFFESEVPLSEDIRFNLCSTHQKTLNQGYATLISVDNDKSPMFASLYDAYRLNNMTYVKVEDLYEHMPQVFPINDYNIVFVTPSFMDNLDNILIEYGIN